MIRRTLVALLMLPALALASYAAAAFMTVNTVLPDAPTKPPQLMRIVNRSPFCGVNIEPRMNRPKRNMSVTEAIRRAARPRFLSIIWPPPGISQATATAGSHCPIGADGAFASCS